MVKVPKLCNMSIMQYNSQHFYLDIIIRTKWLHINTISGLIMVFFYTNQICSDLQNQQLFHVLLTPASYLQVSRIFFSSCVPEQKQFSGSCLVAATLCRWKSPPPPSHPFLLPSLCFLSMQTVGDIAAVPLLPTVLLICVYIPLLRST